IGPAFLAYPTPPLGITLTEATIVLEAGIALLPNNNGYLLFPLTIQAINSTVALIFPVGFQYDVPLPLRGLYIPPRATLGYGLGIGTVSTGLGTSTTFVSHVGVFTPEVGIKYVLSRRVNLGLDVFSLPVAFNQDGAEVFYRLLFYAGVNL